MKNIFRVSSIFVICLIIIVLTAGCSSFKKQVFLEKKIAEIEIKGPIVSSQKAVNEIEGFADKKDIGAIILRLETPGGGVAASQEIHREIIKARNKGKLIIVSMGSVAASGGYYIACAADKIFADGGTLTGSIGVIINIANFEDLLNKIGIQFQVVKSGPHKDIGSFSRKLTKEEKELLEGVIKDIYDQFVNAIAEGRGEILREKLTRELKKDKKNISNDDIKKEIYKIADGRIFTGMQAKTYGLVDEIGSFTDVVKYTADILNIKGEPVIEIPRKKTSIFEFIFGNEADSILAKYMNDAPLKYQMNIGGYNQ